MAIYCHAYTFDESEVRRALHDASLNRDGYRRLRQLAVDSLKSAPEMILRGLGYDEEWLSDADGAWRVEEWTLMVMAHHLEALPAIEPPLIGTTLIALSEGDWPDAQVKRLLEGDKSLDLLIADSGSDVSTSVPVSSKRWLGLPDVRNLLAELESTRDLFLNPPPKLLDRLSKKSDEGWQHGWNAAPRTYLCDTWNQISGRFADAARKGKALLQWSDAPLCL